MNEKEIIDILNSYTTDLYHSYKGDVILKAIRGLLDLYNKEKDKNRILEDLLKGKLYELYLYYKDLAGSYQANSISKDKIKELQGKLCMQLGSYVRNESTPHQERIAGGINILQELLEEVE